MKQFPHPTTALNLRAQVVSTLLQVQQGQSLSHLLPEALASVSERDRALFHELVLGTLRQWHALKAVTLPLLTKPLNNATVETCLYLGLYQVLCTRIAAHAAISETVTASKQLGFHALSGIVNAILRRVQREKEHFSKALEQAHGLPSWLYKRLKKDWPEQLTALLQTLKQIAPLTLRINVRQINRDDYLTALTEQGIRARACHYSNVAITLEQSVLIQSLPGFKQGWFSVQDEHAQLSALSLEHLDHKIVLDACAAPGGKTAHLLERFSPAALVALDQSQSRLMRVSENLERLRLDQRHVSIVAGDASHWQAEKPVDYILLDAPCSAIGVMRRHPDIRLLRQSQDIEQTVTLQRQILDQMWLALKPGGEMLYVTCSILKAENEQQMVAFFDRHQDAQEIKLDWNFGLEQIHGRQLLPLPNQGDGFYYCHIKKALNQ